MYPVSSDAVLSWFSSNRSQLEQADHKTFSLPESRKTLSKTPKVQSNTASGQSRGYSSKR